MKQKIKQNKKKTKKRKKMKDILRIWGTPSFCCYFVLVCESSTDGLMYTRLETCLEVGKCDLKSEPYEYAKRLLHLLVEGPSVEDQLVQEFEI